MQEITKLNEVEFRLDTWGENWKITVGEWDDKKWSTFAESDTWYIEMLFDHSPSIADITMKIEQYFEDLWDQAHP